MQSLPIETEQERNARLERLGVMDPNCPSCKPFYEAASPLDVMMPRHKASDRCESGKRPHCSCDACF